MAGVKIKELDDDIELLWSKGWAGHSLGLSNRPEAQVRPPTRQKLEDVYHVKSLEQYLGKGAFGLCFTANHSASERFCAVKTISRKAPASDWYYNNFVKQDVYGKLLNMTISHPHRNVVKYYDFLLGAHNLCVVMSPLSGAELSDAIKERAPLTEEFCRGVMRDTLSALQHVHKAGLMHRDVKLESLRFETTSPDAPLVLFDFGLCCTLDRPAPSQCCDWVGTSKLEAMGTMPYIAPEVWSGHYGARVDVWSAGIVFYVLLVGSLPFKVIQGVPVSQKALEEALDCDLLEKAPPEAVQLLKDLLVINPEMRSSSAKGKRHLWHSSDSANWVKTGTSFEDLESVLNESRNSPYAGTATGSMS